MCPAQFCDGIARIGAVSQRNGFAGNSDDEQRQGRDEYCSDVLWHGIAAISNGIA